MNKKTILGIAIIALTAIVAIIGCNKNGTSAGGGSRAVKYNPESDFEVRAVDGGAGVEITKYFGDKWEVNIPPKIRDLPVTSIGREAFSEKSLISVTIVYQVNHLQLQNNHKRRNRQINNTPYCREESVSCLPRFFLSGYSQVNTAGETAAGPFPGLICAGSLSGENLRCP